MVRVTLWRRDVGRTSVWALVLILIVIFLLIVGPSLIVVLALIAIPL